MAGKLTQPPENYALAFQAYLGASTGHFLIKTNGIFLAYYEETTYKVIHFDDLLLDIKSYFSGSFTKVYTEISFGLWFNLFDKYKDVSEEDQIIDFYKAWKIYWNNETLFIGTAENFAIEKQQGWEDFELFLARIKINPEIIVQSAIEISDLHLIPVIALAIGMRYPDEDRFYRECVDILVKDYPHDFGVIGNLEEVDLNPNDPGTQRYFIGVSEFNFYAYRELGEDL